MGRARRLCHVGRDNLAKALRIVYPCAPNEALVNGSVQSMTPPGSSSRRSKLQALLQDRSALRAKVLRLLRFASISGFLLGFKFGWMWLLDGRMNPQLSYAGVQVVILFLSYGLHATFSFQSKFSWSSFWRYCQVVVFLSLTDYLIFSVVFSLLNITALPSVAAATLGVWLLRYSVVSRVFRNESEAPRT